MTPREETEQHIRETEARIAAQIERVLTFDEKGRFDEAHVARTLLGVLSAKLSSLQARLRAVKAAERSGFSPEPR